MAKLLTFRNSYIVGFSLSPIKNTSRTNILPKAVPITDKYDAHLNNNSPEDMLRNLRIAVTPSYGFGSNTYKSDTPSSSPSKSTLAGDPKHVSTRQDIRAEILEKWNTRPKPDIHREWMKNVIFN